MATATKKTRAAGQVARGAGGVSGPALMEFLIFEDNGGGYHWTIVGVGSESLVESGSFAYYDEAEHAARVVREGAGSARCGGRAARDRPVDLVARRQAPTGDDPDAERWLDEGGGFSIEEVAKWQAEH